MQSVSLLERPVIPTVQRVLIVAALYLLPVLALALTAALVAQNAFGFATVLYIPVVVSAGQVQTAFRRAAQQRLYPLTLSAICPFNDISFTELTAVATS